MNSVPTLQHLQRMALELGGTARVAGSTINAQGQQVRTTAPARSESPTRETPHPAAPFTLDDIRALLDERNAALERRLGDMLRAISPQKIE